MAILDSTGTCIAEYTYDAWGNCRVTKDTNTIAYTNPLRYRGYYYDTDTDMYYLQSRYNDANIGRFINADMPEMIVNDVLNLYSYCNNDPINNSDKNGSWCYNIKYCAFNDQIKGKMMNRYNKNKKAMNHYYKSMIYAQHNAPITNMNYLDSDLSDTGCEIIATYNSMKRMNKNVFLAGVILEFEMNGMYYVRSGKLGSDPYSLGSYFKAHKVKYDSWYSKSKFLKNVKSGKKSGIISFWNNNGKLFWKQGIHTVAYWYDKKTKCYYLPNYNCNHPNDVTTWACKEINMKITYDNNSESKAAYNGELILNSEKTDLSIEIIGTGDTMDFYKTEDYYEADEGDKKLFSGEFNFKNEKKFELKIIDNKFLSGDIKKLTFEEK